MASETVSACWASIIGWRGYVGSIPVPSDLGDLPADDREDRQGVEPEDLRDPVGAEALLGRFPCPGDRPVDARRLSTEDSHAHGPEASDVCSGTSRVFEGSVGGTGLV